MTKLDVKYTVNASTSLKEIGQFTQARWGKKKRKNYLSCIKESVHLIRPDIGAVRGDVLKGMRSYPCLEHVIYYRHFENTLIVIDVLHHRMDPCRLHSR